MNNSIVRFLLPSLFPQEQQKPEEHVEDGETTSSKNRRNHSASSSKGKTTSTNTMTLQAMPGLVTFLDFALHRSYEGQVSATLCSTNTLLHSFLHLKHVSAHLLHVLSIEGCNTLTELASIASSSSSSSLNTHQNTDGSSSSSFSSSSSSTDGPSWKDPQIFIFIQATARFISMIQTWIQETLDYAHQSIEQLTTDPLSLTTHYITSTYTTMNTSNNNNSAMMYSSMDTHQGSFQESSAATAASIDKQNHPKHNSNHQHSTTNTTTSHHHTTTTTNTRSGCNNPTIGDDLYNQYIQSIMDVPLLHENGQRIAPSSSYSSMYHVESSSTTTGSFVSNTSTNNMNTSTTTKNQYHSRQSHHKARGGGNGGGGGGGGSGIMEVQQDLSTSTYYRSYSRMDCWESCKLHCFDYVWASEFYTNNCNFLRNNILRQDFIQMFLQHNTTTNHTSSSILFHQQNQQEQQDIFKQIWNQCFVGEMNHTLIHSTTSCTTQLEVFLYKLCFPLVSKILSLLLYDVPQQLTSFKCSIEINATILKRLYCIKNEYRIPFRAFLESHVHVQRMPCLSVVDSYLNIAGDPSTVTSIQQVEEEEEEFHQNNNNHHHPIWKQKKREAERKLQDAIQNPILVETLEIEKACEELEIEMYQMLLPFGELSRFIESKGGRIISLMTEEDNIIIVNNLIPKLEELIRRLALLFVPKPSNPTSNGIRQILLDLQGLKRDTSLSNFEMELFGSFDYLSPREAACERVKVFLYELSTLCSSAQITGGVYFLEKKAILPISLLNACTASLDTELFQALFEDWYDLIQSQGALISNQANAAGKQVDESMATTTVKDKSLTIFQNLSKVILQAEMELSIAMAPYHALATVRQKLEQVESDRIKRFQILRGIVQDISVRDMDLHIDLSCPDQQTVLRLPEMPSANGIFGVLLQSHGEMLPL